jgi:hypothetical protein
LLVDENTAVTSESFAASADTAKSIVTSKKARVAFRVIFIGNHMLTAPMDRYR